MRNAVRVLLAATAACFLGAASTARPCECSFTGKVVCPGTTQGVDLVKVYLYVDQTVWASAVTGADGSFSGVVGGPQTLNVALDLGPAGVTGTGQYVFEPPTTCTDLGTPITLPTFEVSVPGCSPPPPPPPPGCQAPEGMRTGAYCPARPLGNPKAECSLLGLAPLDKDDGLNGQSFVATTDAAAALVKSGSCYNIYANVTKGEFLFPVPNSGGISHVTYCTCP
jgi:hypothetical protein